MVKRAILTAIGIVWAASAHAQGHGYTPADIENGGQLYQANCTACHGPDGDGVPSINLGSGKFRRGTTDDEIVKIIIGGIPGTAMPPSSFSEGQAGTIVAYLRSLASAPTTGMLKGDAARGQALFTGKGQCQNCHSVAGVGARGGPSLSEVGGSRRAIELQRAIVEPSADIRSDHRPARVVTRDGATITGRLLNQDSFTVQLLDNSGRLRLLDKSTIREFTILKDSPMPSYKDKLNAQEIADLVTYLTTLKGHDDFEKARIDGVLVGVLAAAASVSGQVREWTTYSGDMLGQRHSPLTQITADNVKNLELQWVFQARSLEKFEATPLVVDGVMYTVQPPNDVVAMDAATGRVFWVYPYIPSPLARLCCGRVNRGLAIHENTLYMATIDGRLIAIDAKTGGLVWNVAVGGARPDTGYSLTVAPLVVKDKVILGTAGGEYGVRGFIAAFDAKSGREAWRFYTIAGPGERGAETWAGDSWKTGGGSIWVTGTYDADLNLTSWGVGNPGPDWNGDGRLGDNLYSDSVVALDADTGALKWHFQFTPHDVYDYDSVQVPVLADIQWQGKPRKAMLFGNRNGFFYVLDRTNGQFLLGKPFTKVTWTSGLDAKGRPQNMVPLTEDGVLIYPGVQGGTNWYSPAFSPRTNLFYLPMWGDTYSTFTKRPVEYKEGQRFTGALPAMPIRLLTPGPSINRRRPEEGWGGIQAIDPNTGEKKWEYKMADVVDAGVLSTASDLLFTGGREGYALVLDAKSGALLWKANVGGSVSNGPMTYMLGGRQYVAFAAGSSLFVYALRQ